MKKHKLVKYKTDEYSLEFIQKNLCDATYVFFCNEDAIYDFNVDADEIIKDLEKYKEVFSCYPFFEKQNLLISNIENPLLELIKNGKKLEYFNIPSPECMVIKAGEFKSIYKEFFLKDAINNLGQDLYRFKSDNWHFTQNEEYINKTKSKECIDEANHFYSVNKDGMKNTIDKIRNLK